MASEEQFLQSIRKEPCNEGLRLTYADWLEEHGDLRAAMIRVEQEMRSVPIYSDRYWELKPQRHAFQDFCEEKRYDDWLFKLGYHRRYEPVFSQTPETVKQRWRLIREFVERWHGIRMSDVHGRSRKGKRIEAAVEQKLPESIHHWITLVHDLGKKFIEISGDDVFVGERMSQHRGIALTVLPHSHTYRVVRDEHLSLADPPVDRYQMNQDEPSDGYYRVGEEFETMSAFALYGLSSNGSLFQEDRAIDSLAAEHGIAESKFVEFSIYEAENAFLLVSPHRASYRLCIANTPPDDQIHPFFRQLRPWRNNG